MTIKIEKNVPLPNTGKAWGKYPWRQMQPGDSFFVPGRTAQQFAGSVSDVRRRHGFDLVSRTVEENGVKGVRVWRLA